MSPVVQHVIELLVMLVMIAWRMIIWVSSCLDPSEASASMTQAVAHSREDTGGTDTGCGRHGCQVLNSILNLSRESSSLLHVWASMRRYHPSDLREADNDASGVEASDEESWVSWVNVITFLKDNNDRKSIFLFLFFLKVWNTNWETEISRMNNKEFVEFDIRFSKHNAKSRNVTLHYISSEWDQSRSQHQCTALLHWPPRAYRGPGQSSSVR